MSKSNPTYIEKCFTRLRELEDGHGLPHDFTLYTFWSAAGVEVALKTPGTSGLFNVETPGRKERRGKGAKALYGWLFTDDAVAAMCSALAYRDYYMAREEQLKNGHV